jgi:hypothetical protein
MPRLIYADWLEERGCPRSEFIRVQCEMEQTQETARYQQLREMEKELLKQHEREWLVGLARDQIGYLRFRRGFVESIQTTVKYFHQFIADRYYLWSIQTVDLSISGAGDIRLLHGTPELARIRTLKLSNNTLGAPGIRGLLECENVASLRELYLTSCGLDAQCISLLADSPLLSRLRNLMVGGNVIGDEGASALAESPCLTNLEQLGIAFCRIEEAGAAALAGSSNLPLLQTLRFAGNTDENPALVRLIDRFGDGLLF